MPVTECGPWLPLRYYHKKAEVKGPLSQYCCTTNQPTGQTRMRGEKKKHSVTLGNASPRRTAILSRAKSMHHPKRKKMENTSSSSKKVVKMAHSCSFVRSRVEWLPRRKGPSWIPSEQAAEQPGTRTSWAVCIPQNCLSAVSSSFECPWYSQQARQGNVFPFYKWVR